eukprot:COSAG06_NODE_28618_length_571_cov_0.788136_1_plen_42_part_01
MLCVVEASRAASHIQFVHIAARRSVWVVTCGDSGRQSDKPSL